MSGIEVTDYMTPAHHLGEVRADGDGTCTSPACWCIAEVIQAMPDAVNHPSHYTSHPSGVECIEITEHMSFNLGNAIKYVWRQSLKGGIQDLEKAAWYLDREIERLKRVQG